MEETIRVREADAVVKLSTCPTCSGLIRVAVKHLMDAKSKREFAREAFEHNLKVSEMTLEAFQKEKTGWCSC